MKDDNYVVIQGWMCNELELKGNELLIYALIYGFSQDGESEFSGSRNYIAHTFNISLPTVDKAITNLLEKELIDKRIEIKNNIQTNFYKTLHPVKKFYYPSKETLHNNTNNKNSNKTNTNVLVENSEFLKSAHKPKKKESLYNQCIALTDEFVSKHNCGEPVRSLLIQYLNLRLEMRDKQMYANQWKGLLNKLEELHKQGFAYSKIIQQSVEKGYAGFYPVNEYSTKRDSFSQGSGLKSDKLTEDELAHQEKFRDDLKRQKKRVEF